MSNLVKHAQKELELIGAFSEEDDFYGGETGKAVLELIQVFADQGHSGMSASIVRGLFNTLANFKPVSPLTLKDDEWTQRNNFEDEGAGDNCSFQNIRNSAVFKNSKDGKPYYVDAFYKKTQTGTTWSGNLTVGDGRTLIKCYIKDPAKLPKICIDIIDWEVEKENEDVLSPGSGWWLSKMKDIDQLKRLEEFYELEFVSE